MMNIVLDVLRLRRVRLDYVSPAICQVILSGSGSAMFLEANEGPVAPGSLAFGGQCERFLQWTQSPDTICTSLYKASNPGDPETHYTLVSECLPQGYVNVCTPGWWRFSTVTPEGVESDLSTPVFVDGSVRVNIPVVLPAGAVRFNLYKNPDPLVQFGTYGLVLSSVSSGAFEVCDPTGCYRLQTITHEGSSELSAQICRGLHINCCPAMPCSPKYIWSDSLCSCVFDDFSDILPAEPCCQGVAYASQFTAVGGVSPFLWELVSGTVPTGLTYHTGLFIGQSAPITGTPTTGGDYTFTIRCTSSSGTAIEKTFTMTCLGLSAYPTLPDATTDTLYGELLSALGGAAPYTYSLVAGSLPAGISLIAGGVLTGTPSFPGSESFTIQVTDSNNISCDIVMSLEVVGCPVLTPIAPVAAAGTKYYFGALDKQRRVLWLPESQYIASPAPYQVVRLFSTIGASPAFSGVATDSGNLINTAAKGDLDSLGYCVIDTKYNQCVISGGQYTVGYDLDTKNAVWVSALTPPAGGPTAFSTPQPAYDAVRGVIYLGQASGYPFGAAVWVFDCNPAVHNVIAEHRAQPGPAYPYSASGALCYHPGTDTVYMPNPNGPNLFHKWLPTSNTFIMNQGPATASTYAKYIPGIDCVVFQTAAGIVLIDPNSGDAVVGTAAYNGGGTLRWAEFNDCSGTFYLIGESGAGFDEFTLPALTSVNQDPGVFRRSILFDQYCQRTFSPNTNDWTISVV